MKKQILTKKVAKHSYMNLCYQNILFDTYCVLRIREIVDEFKHCVQNAIHK